MVWAAAKGARRKNRTRSGTAFRIAGESVGGADAGGVGGVVADHFADALAVDETVGGLDELAEEVLSVLDGVGGFLHGDEVRVDFRAVVDIGKDAVPARVFVVPDVVEETGLAARIWPWVRATAGETDQ